MLGWAQAEGGTVQGSAADFMKGATVQLLADLRTEGLGQHCRMVVQVCITLLPVDTCRTC